MAFSLMLIGETMLEIDPAMTAVLCRALDGDAAAALVLSHVVGRAELHGPFATELSGAWLAHQLRHFPSRHRFIEEEARLWSAIRTQDEPTAAGKENQP